MAVSTGRVLCAGEAGQGAPFSLLQTEALAGCFWRLSRFRTLLPVCLDHVCSRHMPQASACPTNGAS